MSLAQFRPQRTITLTKSVVTVAAAVAVSLLPVRPAAAELPQITLSGVFPPGGQAGAEVEVQINGGNLDGAETLRFSHAGITAQPKMQEPDEFHEKPRPVPNRFVVHIKDDVPAGIYEARAVGRYGISNPRAFVVSNRKEVTKQGNPNQPEKAMPLEVGTVVNARVGNRQIDYYSVELKKGQRVVIDCLAHRIDSRMHAVLKLWDQNGEFLRRVRSTDDGDPVLDFTAPAAGEYLLGVFDVIYQGGGNYFYRLTVRETPHIDFVMPPAAEPGSKRTFTVYGRNLPDGEPAEGMRLHGAQLEQTTVQVPLAGKDEDQLPLASVFEPHSGLLSGKLFRLENSRGPSNPVLIQYATAPVVVEKGQNETPEQAQQVKVPCEFAGQIHPRGDRDWVSFKAEKGKEYWIQVLANRLGLPVDPAIVVEQVTTNDKGETQVKQVGSADNSGTNYQDALLRTSSEDPVYRLTADDAVYRVRIKDVLDNPTSDPRVTYRLLIHEKRPDFHLVAYPEPPTDPNNRRNNTVSPASLVLRRGGTGVLRVHAFRENGYRGPIHITAEGLPEGVTCRGATLDGPVTRGWLVFEAKEDAKKWAGPVRLQAKATIDGKEVVRNARAATLVWSADRDQPQVSRLARDVTLAVVDAEQAPVSLEIEGDGVFETALGGKVQIPVKAAKREKLKGNLQVQGVRLHNDINFNNTNIKDDSGKIELEIRDDDVPVGTYTFYLQGQTKFQYKRNQDAVKEAQQEQKRAQEIVNQTKKAEQQAKQASQQAEKEAQAAAQALKQAQQIVEQTGKQAEQAKQQVQETEKAVAQAKEAKQKADKGVDAAQKAVTEAEKALQQAEQKHKEAQEAKQKADKDVEAAQKDVAEAEKTVKQAEQKLKEAKEAASNDPDNKDKAEAVKKAEQELKEAKERKQKADQKLEQAQKTAEEAAKALKQTEQQLKQAKESKQKADQTLDQAKKAAAEAGTKFQETEKKLQEAQKQHQDAQKKLEGARKAVDEAQKKNEEAQKAKEQAAEKAQQTEAKRKRAENFKKQADNRLNQVKKQNKPQDVTVYVASSPVTLRIKQHAIEVEAKAPGKLKQGGKLEVPVKVKRLYGFEDNVNLKLDLPGSAKGVNANAQNIAKGKTDGKLVLNANDNAAPGQHTAQLELQYRFGRVNHRMQTEVTFEVEKVEKKKADGG